jgi:hypothetical protein
MVSGQPVSNAVTNCIVNPPDYDPKVTGTILNIAGWNYYTIGFCSIPEAIISGGEPCEPPTNGLIPELGSSSANAQRCTAEWGYYYPLWVVNIG